MQRGGAVELTLLLCLTHGAGETGSAGCNRENTLGVIRGFRAAVRDRVPLICQKKSDGQLHICLHIYPGRPTVGYLFGSALRRFPSYRG